MKRFLVMWGLLAFSHADAQLQVLACEPEWAALARVLVTKDSQVFSATHALQDPHHIEAKPSLLARARQTDLLICTGAELEIGWLPILQQESGNPRIQVGQPGYFEVAEVVELLEKMEKVDRRYGDVHAAGNPHIQTTPYTFLIAANFLSQRLAAIDPKNRSFYQEQFQEFQKDWVLAIKHWEKKATPLRGLPVIVQHKSFSYLLDWLQLKEIACLESKPGMEPSVSHLNKLLIETKKSSAERILVVDYQNKRPAQWMAERSGIRLVELPGTLKNWEEPGALFNYFDTLLNRLL